MTALKKYQRLECPGLWRPAPEEQRREVAVAFGEASLVLLDSRSLVPLAHWSLPAVKRRNPGEAPAIYSPDPDAGETLELEDQDMIEALETVQRSLRSGVQNRVSLRLATLGGIFVVLLGMAVFWLPDALVRHAISVVPQAKRAEIAQMIIADLARSGHPTCTASVGLRALTRLRERVTGGPAGGTTRLAVLAGSDAPAAVPLPGGVIVLGQPMIEAHDSPEVAAGHILAAGLAAQFDDPLRAALKAAGLRATLVLLTTGELSETALRGHGATLLAARPLSPDTAALLARFEAAQVAASPYAYAVDPTGEATIDLIEADPFRSVPAPRPLLSDGEWVSLQGICSG